MKKKCFIYLIPIMFLLFLALPSTARADIPEFDEGLTGIQKKETDFYLLDEDSNVLTGWQDYAGNRYYFSKKTGKMFFGIKKIKNVLYYFDENGVCIPDVVFNKNESLMHGFYEGENGRQYYFKGKMVKGFTNILGVNYYFNEETGIMEDYDTALAKYRENLKNTEKTVTNKASRGFVKVNNITLHDGYYKHPSVDIRTLLAAIIYLEAGNQKEKTYLTTDGEPVYESQLAVGYVITNLVTDRMGVKELIYKKNAFTPARDGKLLKLLNNPEKIPKEPYLVADIVIDLLNHNIERVPDFPRSEFKWTNFWTLSYAKNKTNFFKVFPNKSDYEIIQDIVFFKYSRALKGK